jgi:hypothetical protein
MIRKKMCEEANKTSLKYVIPHSLPSWTEKNHSECRQDSPSSESDSNAGPLRIHNRNVNYLPTKFGYK